MHLLNRDARLWTWPTNVLADAAQQPLQRASARDELEAPVYWSTENWRTESLDRGGGSCPSRSLPSVELELPHRQFDLAQPVARRAQVAALLVCEEIAPARAPPPASERGLSASAASLLSARTRDINCTTSS